MNIRALMMLAVASVTPLGAQAPTMAHARQLFEARNYDAAHAEFAALAKASANDPVPELYLGRIALEKNETEDAIKHFERCTEISDRNADCHAWLGNALGTAAQHTSKFKLPFLAKRTKKEFERAVELDPDNVEGRSGMFQYYLQAPGFLGGSADKAREQAAEIEKRSKLRGALAYGQVADHEKNVVDAEHAYQKAIAAQPDSSIGYNALLNLYIREKRWSDSFGILDRMGQRLPNERGVLLAVGAVSVLSGEQLQRGEDALKKWMADPPPTASVNSQSTAHLRLGRIYEKTGRKDLARAEFQHAVSLNGKNEDAKKALDALR